MASMMALPYLSVWKGREGEEPAEHVTVLLLMEGGGHPDLWPHPLISPVPLGSHDLPGAPRHVGPQSAVLSAHPVPYSPPDGHMCAAQCMWAHPPYECLTPTHRPSAAECEAGMCPRGCLIAWRQSRTRGLMRRRPVRELAGTDGARLGGLALFTREAPVSLI
ncbi:hypothetical protein SKAU_G00323560 [Synaphobranchus kaupii]|uniref:Uncharacterized protein n=1 Tax=Synaphobranchus kaupii TaxID=118154 RepID=A0A9Q1EP52_SYNKA|nr:hypothetical protein SKAU_G00323560 [Synaphobranchus kaupii]